jgi:hypothetical protein
VSLVEQEQPEEGAEYFTKLVRDYSKSEYAKKGKDYLEKLGKQVPEPSNENPAPERPNIIGKVGLIFGRNGLETSEDGVLLRKKGRGKEDVKATAKPSEVSNQPGTRPIRATTKGAAAPDQADTLASPAGQTAGETDKAPSADQTTTPEAKNGESKKKDKKEKDSKKKEKDKKHSSGVSE